MPQKRRTYRYPAILGPGHKLFIYKETVPDIMQIRILIALALSLFVIGSARADQSPIRMLESSTPFDNALGTTTSDFETVLNKALNPALKRALSQSARSSCAALQHPQPYQWCLEQGTRTIKMYSAPAGSNRYSWQTAFTINADGRLTPSGLVIGAFGGRHLGSATAAGAKALPALSASDYRFIPSGTGVSRIAAGDKLAKNVDLADFGVVCDGSDEHAKVQNAIDSVASGGVIFKSCSGYVGLGPTDATASLYIRKPVVFRCIGGGGFIPLPTLSYSVSIFYFEASADSIHPSAIDGCYVGDPNTGTRSGNHAVYLDAGQYPGDIFFSARNGTHIKQNPSAPASRAIYAINSCTPGVVTLSGTMCPASGTLNIVGGVHNTTLCDNSIMWGGIDLRNVGDSVILHNCTQVGAGQLYVSLVHAGGGTAGNFVLNGGGLSNTGGIQIDCAASAIIESFEAEQSATTTNPGNALVYLAGAVCKLYGVFIKNGQVQSNPNQGLTSLIRVGNAAGVHLEDLVLADSSSTTIPNVWFTSLSTGAVYGVGNRINGTSPANLDQGAGTRATIAIPFSAVPVTCTAGAPTAGFTVSDGIVTHC